MSMAIWKRDNTILAMLDTTKYQISLLDVNASLGKKQNANHEVRVQKLMFAAASNEMFVCVRVFVFVRQNARIG